MTIKWCFSLSLLPLYPPITFLSSANEKAKKKKRTATDSPDLPVVKYPTQ